jgi:hypothetical protein
MILKKYFSPGKIQFSESLQFRRRLRQGRPRRFEEYGSVQKRRGAEVKWIFEGVTELLPVYEEREDGAEIMWSENKQKLKKLRKRVRSKGGFKQKPRQR